MLISTSLHLHSHKFKYDYFHLEKKHPTTPCSFWNTIQTHITRLSLIYSYCIFVWNSLVRAGNKQILPCVYNLHNNTLLKNFMVVRELHALLSPEDIVYKNYLNITFFYIICSPYFATTEDSIYSNMHFYAICVAIYWR